jgi:hypothetical protein
MSTSIDKQIGHGASTEAPSSPRRALCLLSSNAGPPDTRHFAPLSPYLKATVLPQKEYWRSASSPKKIIHV